MARIWDSYLSERDKAHLELSGPKRPVGFGTKPAILMIDNYRGVFGTEPQPILEAVATAGRGNIGMDAWAAASRITELLSAARAAGIPVVHITGLGDAGMPGWSASVHAGDRRGDLSVEGNVQDRYEIVPQCAPIDGEVVLKKSAPSAFWGTPLPAVLNFLGVDTLIVGGESTSGCVRASVVEAAAHRYRVIVAEECCYDRHEACHAINLFDMDQKYADVLPLDDVVDWIDAYRDSTGAAVAALAGG